MSIDTCKKCGDSVDTDHDLMCYVGDDCICDKCQVWSDVKPTIDGLYWFRCEDMEPWIIEIIEGDMWEDGILINWPVIGEYMAKVV